MQPRQCAKCGSPMEYKEGISKAGKPYKMWKCKGCQEIEWIRNNYRPQATQQTQQTQQPNSFSDNLEIIGLLQSILGELKELNKNTKSSEINDEDLSQFGI